MIPIFIASTKGYSGKTFVALGLAMKLAEKGYRIGYIKPLGKTPVKKGSRVVDADALFMKEVLSLHDPLDVISPFVLGYETQNLIFQGKIKDVKKPAMAAFNSLKNKDFVIVGGAGDLFEGAMLDMDAFNLIRQMKAYALVVESWTGDTTMDSLYGAQRLLEERVIGGVLNKVPSGALGHVKNTVKPFMEKRGVRIFGIFQKDSILESFTVRQLNEILGGKVLCCEDRLDDFVENFSIGAMDVDSALTYFRRIPNKAVITGAHRSDIQLAAMETSTKCIVLTGGLYTNSLVIGRAQSKGIPVISVPDDTFATIDKIESAIGKTRIREKGKIKRIKEIFSAEFDMERFLSVFSK